MVREIALKDVGLLSVADAAAELGAAPRTVQKWIADGLLPVVVAGGGMRTVYLLRAADVKGFTPPPMGRPRKDATAPGPAKKAAGRKK
ncbi:helix-turn-helix domain-containing protein [Gemmata sp.]|uniref:helix-turn-helix domain-containing protein n=1 Tax=Gemmata sp. TaxID=1914242 RepID=UPI003F71118D